MEDFSISGRPKGKQTGAQAVPAAESKLAAEMMAMGVDGGRADPEAGGYFLGAESFADQFRDLDLGRSEGLADRGQTMTKGPVSSLRP